MKSGRRGNPDKLYGLLRFGSMPNLATTILGFRPRIAVRVHPDTVHRERGKLSTEWFLWSLLTATFRQTTSHRFDDFFCGRHNAENDLSAAINYRLAVCYDLKLAVPSVDHLYLGFEFTSYLSRHPDSMKTGNSVRTISNRYFHKPAAPFSFSSLRNSSSVSCLMPRAKARASLEPGSSPTTR